MTQKEKSARLFQKNIDLFICPHCHSTMMVEQLKSLVCSNKHTFDFAKQGYVNLMTRPGNNQYDKKLFAARRSIIVESKLYKGLHETIAEVINRQLHNSQDERFILDAGCGEGSHLQQILDACMNKATTGIGLDISKEGIRMAAGKYKESIWLVADLAHSPLADQSCHVILNILSPANYQDFKRVLAEEGLVIKVIPRSQYLKELREALFENKPYKNDETVTLFKEHFQLVDHLELNYTVELSQEELSQLVQMSPLSWNATEEQLESFIKQGSSEITIDLDILIGKK